MTDPLTNYYSTVYPTLCTPDSRYLSSKEGNIYWSRLITLLSLPIQLLTTFCIIKKTPESMISVKNSLLNLNFWCIFAGVFKAFFAVSFSFFPANAAFCVGLATDLGVPMGFQLYLNFALVSAILISITILFENRSSLITSNIFAIRKSYKRKIWITANFLFSMAMLAPVFLNPPEQKSAKLGILKDLPCPSKEFFTEPFLVMAYTPFWKSYFTVSLGLVYLVLLLQILFFSICCMYYLYVSKSPKMSSQTRKIQIRSFFGLLVQTIIPILFDSVPMMVFLNRQANGDYDQFNNNLTGLSVIIHGGATSLSIILVQHPYRKYLFEKVFCGRISKKNHVMESKVITVVISGNRST